MMASSAQPPAENEQLVLKTLGTLRVGGGRHLLLRRLYESPGNSSVPI